MTRPLAPALLFALALAGCDAAGPDDRPPAVIAPAAFAVDLGAFPDDGARVAAGANYLTSAARVGVVSAVVGANLVLPEQATRAAAGSRPDSSSGDGVFVWDATVDVFQNDVRIRLTADVDGDDVGWALTTENESDGLDDGPFTYYTAETSFDGREGTWRLFNPGVESPVLTATFDVDDSPEVTFAVPEGRDQAGARVRYETDGTRRTFDFVDARWGRSLVVWDLVTGAGSVTADDYNGGERACWDGDLDDVAC